uniref:Uncharacterized protein n=1 Tax=Odontella aurita TaxID=265563 RepID=A0A7S4MSJ2_9STRA|mmetsp:Transcript_30091/g.89455  ORF Transcript_30091/g.89455 Transcript_30091/m.89455 type:complete len:571 (+) Transcript_30091:77-1789(+)
MREGGLGTLRRYTSFVAAIARTSFFCPSDCDDDTGVYSVHQHSEGCHTSILVAVFAPAFAKYALSTAISDVLRYAILVSTVGVAKNDLPLIIGACDALCAVGDVLLRVQGSWDMAKARLVGNKSGPITAAAIYCVGVATVISSAMELGCGTDTDMVEPTGTGALQESHGLKCNTYFYALALYTIGSYLMRIGHGLLWNVWTQTFKHHAEKRLVAINTSEEEDSLEEEGNQDSSGANRAILLDFDIQGKLSQLQVLLRYAACSVAPPCAAYLLSCTNQSPTAVYSIVGLCFLLLCCCIAKIVELIGENKESNSSASQRIRPIQSSARSAARLVSWSEMLPKRMASCLHPPSATHTESGPLVVSGNSSYAGRFSSSFFHLGAFISLTEIVRGGYTRVLCLMVVTSDLSHADLSHALSVTGTLALSTFWLSDLADRNRKLAASISFAVLALGHFALAFSSSIVGFLLSAAIFGLGEGASTGLRALLKQDYLHENGPLGESSTGHDAEGRRLRRQVVNKTGIWSDVTLIANSLVVGVLGHFFGMRTASFAFGVLGLFAAHFSLYTLPDTKPSKY